MSHSIVTLFEADHEGVDELDLVLQDVDQVLDGLLLLDEVVAEPGRVDDGEPGVGCITQEVPLISTSGLCYRCSTVVKTVDFEASIIEACTIVVLVSPHKDVGQAGLPDARRTQDHNPGTLVLMFIRDLKARTGNACISLTSGQFQVLTSTGFRR